MPDLQSWGILQRPVRDKLSALVQVVDNCTCGSSQLRSNHVEEFFLARGSSSSAEVRGLVIQDIKEVEGVRRQEEQEDKRDEETRDEANGEVEEVTQRAHET